MFPTILLEDVVQLLRVSAGVPWQSSFLQCDTSESLLLSVPPLELPLFCQDTLDTMVSILDALTCHSVGMESFCIALYRLHPKWLGPM